MKWSDKAVEAAAIKIVSNISDGKMTWGEICEEVRTALTAALEAEIRAGRAAKGVGVFEGGVYHANGYGDITSADEFSVLILRIETDKDKDNG